MDHRGQQGLRWRRRECMRRPGFGLRHGPGRAQECRPGTGIPGEGLRDAELRACAYAAYLKLQGTDVPKDVPGATRLATKACDGGAMEGCTTLALVRAGSGKPADLAQARTLLTRACAGGEANACGLLKSLPK